jgi:hypothetical protein
MASIAKLTPASWESCVASTTDAAQDRRRLHRIARLVGEVPPRVEPIVNEEPEGDDADRHGSEPLARPFRPLDPGDRDLTEPKHAGGPARNEKEEQAFVEGPQYRVGTNDIEHRRESPFQESVVVAVSAGICAGATEEIDGRVLVILGG